MILSPRIYNLIENFGLLIARLSLAAVFIPAGLGKLQNLAQPIQFFVSLGIPLPEIMAPLVASFELACGVLLLLGLFSRLAALPIIIIMTVAIFTAKMSEISKLTDLANITEFLYIALALLILGYGAGRVSIDGMIFHRKEDVRSGPIEKLP